MAKGFFAGSETFSKPPPPLRPRCGSCGLYKVCESPKMPVTGKGRKKVLLLGEAPGKTEDEKGRQFVGKSGKYLERILRRYGIDMREDCWLHNSLACRPPKNATPTSDQIDHCRPFLTQALDQLCPRLIIPLGGPAIRSLIGPLWKDDPGGPSRWAGVQIPCQEHNAWICPTYHPSHVLREMSEHKLSRVELFFEQHLEAALDLQGRPYSGEIPDYKSQVEVILDDRRAAEIIREMIHQGGWIAFDYETNMLKPDGQDSELVTCSVCLDGKKTIAYPWDGEVIPATRELLRSPLPKIASNLKFEERWTRKHLETRVRNWKWDTMLAAHLIDCRRGICGLKYQAFVLLGQSNYNEHLEQFMGSESATTPNDIVQEIGLQDLLLYNGLDSLLEYHVAMKQMEILGYDPIL